VRNLLRKTKSSPMAAPPIFSGENYQILSVQMKSYLEASGL